MPEPQINHPDHYNRGKVEAIALIQAAGFGIGFVAGNALKYLIRYDAKDNLASNLKKAYWYVDRMTRLVEDRDSTLQALDAKTGAMEHIYPYLPFELCTVLALVQIRQPSAAKVQLKAYLEKIGVEPDVD